MKFKIEKYHLKFLEKVYKINPILIMILCIVFFYGQGVFTNVSTTSGDSKRIKTYVNTFNSIEESFPLWISNKNGGTPLLADPEQLFYCFFKPVLILFGEEYYNLNLNIMILVFILVNAVAVYLFYRNLSISSFGSAVGGILLNCSGLTYLHYISGRLNTFFIISSALFSLSVYKKFIEKRQLSIFLILSVLNGIQIILSGYYYILTFLILFVYGMSIYLERRKGFVLSLKKASIEMFLIVICGISLLAFIFIPLTFYQMEFLISSGFDKLIKLPDKRTLINYFIPVFTYGKEAAQQKIFPHLTILLLPGLAIFFSTTKIKKNLSVYFIVFLGLFYLIIACAIYLPKEIFRTGYEYLPFIRDIRHSLPYTYYGGVLLLAGAIYAFDKKNHNIKVLKVFVSLIVLLLFIFCFDFISVMYNEHDSYFTVTNKSILLFYLGLIVFIVLIYLKNYNYKYLTYLLFISVVIFQVLTPKTIQYFSYYNRDGYKNKYVRILPQWPAIAYKRDQNNKFWTEELISKVGLVGKFRLISKPNHRPPLGWEGNNRVFGFSNYFSNYYKNALGYLLERKIVEKRPHWIDCDFSSLSKVGVEMFNAKYALFKKNEKPKSFENWKQIYEKNNYILWENTSTTINPQGVRVFGDWEINKLEKIDAINSKNLWNKKIVLLQSDPRILKKSQLSLEYHITRKDISSDEIKIEVETSKPAIIFLSEIYSNGWKAKLNGNDIHVLKAFDAFMALAVPEGKSNIIINYNPFSFYIGLAISILTVIILILVRIIISLKNQFKHKDLGIQRIL